MVVPGPTDLPNNEKPVSYGILEKQNAQQRLRRSREIQDQDACDKAAILRNQVVAQLSDNE
jgi:hypothetical protein